jgi:sigma-54-specific transcriptional regulator
VRLVAATNVDLAAAVQAGHFREDLYYRLNVASLDLLPLRERPGDIMPLVNHFVERYGKRLEISEVEITPGAERALLNYAWPGNIRELENVIHHALLICQNGKVTSADLHLSPFEGSSSANYGRKEGTQPSLKLLENVLSDIYEQPIDDLFETLEEAIIRTAYAFCENNQVQTANLLGISRNILRHRLKRFGFLAA